MAFPDKLCSAGFAVGISVVPAFTAPGCSCMILPDKLVVSGWAFGLLVMPPLLFPGRSCMTFPERLDSAGFCGSAANVAELANAIRSAAKMDLLIVGSFLMSEWMHASSYGTGSQKFHDRQEFESVLTLHGDDLIPRVAL